MSVVELYWDKGIQTRRVVLESRKSENIFPMGAVLTNKRRAIGTGHNMNKTHPKYANPNKHVSISIHAEIACLIDASDVRGDTVYVYREDKMGWPAMARPCVNCQNALRDYGVKKMIYSVPHEPYFCEETL